MSDELLINAYFTAEDVTNYCVRCISHEEKENFMVDILNKSILLFQNSDWIYNLDIRRNLVIPISKRNDKNLRHILSRLIVNEMDKLKQHDGYEMFEETYKTDMKALTTGNIFSGSKLLNYKNKIYVNFNLDNDQYGINFSNGRLDLRTYMFQQRLNPFDSGVFISKYISYDFVIPSSEEEKEKSLIEINNYLLRIFADPNALDFLDYEICKALLHKVVNTNHIIYLVGKGSAGKSSLVKLLKSAFTEVYCRTIPSDALTNDREAKLILNISEPQEKFIFLEDPPKKKLSSSIMKTICDGNINVRKLYQNGSTDVDINAKLFITSNNMISFTDNDTGIRRRILYYECKSLFTDDLSIVNNLNVFQAVDINLSPIDKSNLIRYFTMRCPQVLNNEVIIERPISFLNGENVRSFTTFVNELFLKQENYWTYVNDVLDLISIYFNNFEFTTDEVITGLKKIPIEYRLEYWKDKQIGSKRGFFKNIIVNQDNKIRLMNKQPLLRVDGSLSPYCFI